MRKRSENGGETIQCKVFKYLAANKAGAQCLPIATALGVGRKAVEDAVRSMLAKGLVRRVACKISTTWTRQGTAYPVTYNAVKYLTVKGKKPPKDMRGHHPASREAARLEYVRTSRNMPRRPIAKPAIALEEFWGIRPDSHVCASSNNARQYPGESTPSENVEELA
jgi:DNA-binding Lrp family transcriptional regulator